MADKFETQHDCHARLAVVERRLDDHDKVFSKHDERIDKCNQKAEDALLPARGAKALLWLGAAGTTLGAIISFIKRNPLL